MADTKFPSDADGDAIRRIVESGSELDRPMDIDIQIIAPNEVKADSVAERLSSQGFLMKKFFNTDMNDWDVVATKSMYLTHKDIIDLQAEVAALIVDLGCKVDGWGTLGNA